MTTSNKNKPTSLQFRIWEAAARSLPTLNEVRVGLPKNVEDVRMGTLYVLLHSWVTKKVTTLSGPIMIQILDSFTAVTKELNKNSKATGPDAVRLFLKATKGHFNDGSQPIASIARKYKMVQEEAVNRIDEAKNEVKVNSDTVKAIGKRRRGKEDEFYWIDAKSGLTNVYAGKGAKIKFRYALRNDANLPTKQISAAFRSLGEEIASITEAPPKASPAMMTVTAKRVATENRPAFEGLLKAIAPHTSDISNQRVVAIDKVLKQSPDQFGYNTQTLREARKVKALVQAAETAVAKLYGTAERAKRNYDKDYFKR